MRVVVLYNAVSQQDSIEDRDVLVQVETVAESLKRLGHEHFKLACNLNLDSMKKKIRQLHPDVIFNLVESLHSDDSLIYLPPAVLDSLGLHYAGSRAEALFLTTHKLLAKDTLIRAGLPTPEWIVKDAVASSRSNSLPTAGAVSGEGIDSGQWIIKGVWEQGSRDMHDNAVFTGDQREVHRRLDERIRQTGRPAFAERFIEGREFNLALLTGSRGIEILPPAEIDFSAFPAEKPKIVGYKAKWQADSFEYSNTPHRFDFPDADRPLLDRLQDLAVNCWDLFKLRGWARVDFRVDQNNRPWILEVNANPCLSADAGFFASLQQAGIGFDEAIQRILEEV